MLHVTGPDTPVLERLEIRTGLVHSDLVGNVAFQVYAGWQSEVVDAFLQRLLPEAFRQRRGEFRVRRLALRYLREGMPFDRLEVRLQLAELRERALCFRTGFYRDGVKLAWGELDGSWAEPDGAGEWSLVFFLLLYANTRSAVAASIVMLAVPFSAIGAVWLMYGLGYHVSIAAWVGMIALMGLDAETGVFMLLFLDLAHKDAQAAGRLRSLLDLREAVVHGAVKRVRPKLMTVAAAFMGLMPIMWSTGAGADVMKRVAAPMVGGLVTSFLLELLVYPAIYLLWKQRELPAEAETA